MTPKESKTITFSNIRISVWTELTCIILQGWNGQNEIHFRSFKELFRFLCTETGEISAQEHRK